jgi:hypothetical protein
MQRVLVGFRLIARQDGHVASARHIEGAVGAKQRIQSAAVAIERNVGDGMADEPLEQTRLPSLDLTARKVGARGESLRQLLENRFLQIGHPGSLANFPPPGEARPP